MRTRDLALALTASLMAGARAEAVETDALLGRWRHGRHVVDFVQAGPATVGIWLPAKGTFQVWAFEDGLDGPLTLHAPSGPHHDLEIADGGWGQGVWHVALAVTGRGLEVTRGGRTQTWKRAPEDPEPAAEAADAAFAADAAVRGVEAWREVFLPGGSTWSRRAGRTVGGDAVAANLAGLYALPGLSFPWEPVASGRGAGLAAWTVGRYTLSADGEAPSTGSYLTIWAWDGASWKVAFDTGFPDR